MKGRNMTRQKRVVSIIAISIFSLAAVIAVVFGVSIAIIYKDIDFAVDENLFDSSSSFESTVFYADSGKGTDYDPVAIETSGSIRKIHYDLDEISPFIINGFIAVEDKKFYDHSGVDVKRTLLAAINLITKREKTFGASTITQQVIKNISGDNQLTLKRKVSEIIRALHIERVYDKNEILEVYLNIVPMGDNIYGIGAASRAYFGKEPSDLSVEEAATLIGVTNAPTAYSPYLNPDACKRKRDIVLGVIEREGVITDEEYENAIARPITVVPRAEMEDRFDSWFVETAISEICSDLVNRYGISLSAARMMLLGGGYKVYTTMNPDVQGIMEDYFENTENLATEVSNGLNYAMVVCDSGSGNLLGIIGNAGKKEGNRLLNHATVNHIPASTLKPLALYAPLIDAGRINWSTVFDDVPLEFVEREGEYIEYPKNSPDVYAGLTTVKDAIKLSKNTVALRLAKIRTPRTIFDSLKAKFGFDSLVERDGNLTDVDYAPMALGQLSHGIPLIKLTEAYCTFPSDGRWHKARSYLYVLDHNGKLILENKTEEKQVFKESTARIMNQLLMGVTESGTASSVELKNYVECAGKTGTSSGNRDKLFIGYTPSLTSGIWCGYDNSASAGALSKSHLRIWDDVMLLICDENYRGETFSTAGLSCLPYCMDSGELFSENCLYDPRGSRIEYGYFTEDNKPQMKCNRHVVCYYDSLTKGVACDGCPKDELVPISLIRCDDRLFPKEIIITDAEYVFRDVGRYEKRPIDYSLPFFQYSLPEGVYVGRSRGKKQFNSGCYLHDE